MGLKILIEIKAAQSKELSSNHNRGEKGPTPEDARQIMICFQQRDPP